MKKTVVSLTITVLLLMGLAVVQGHSAEVYKIGVLAKDGPVKCLEQWQATANYLTEKIEGSSFEIVPVTLDTVKQHLKDKTIDFLLTNTSHFFITKAKFNTKALVSMINSVQGHEVTSFGAVIFTLAKTTDINNLEDLRGKKFAAVKREGFGGFQMQLKLFLENNIDPDKDFAELIFTDPPQEKAVWRVLNGLSDAGTVRTDTLERMAAAGEIDLNEIKVIHPLQHEGFPFLVSTPLYPEWPFAKLEHVSDEVAQKVTNALKEIPKDSKAAQDARVAGWTEVFDFTPVDELHKALKLDPYASVPAEAKNPAPSESVPAQPNAIAEPVK
jgi:twitching motility protein PilJ